MAGVAVASVLLLLVMARNTGFDSRGLDRAISGEFPVDAVNFIRRNPWAVRYTTLSIGRLPDLLLAAVSRFHRRRTDLYGDEL